MKAVGTSVRGRRDAMGWRLGQLAISRSGDLRIWLAQAELGFALPLGRASGGGAFRNRGALSKGQLGGQSRLRGPRMVDGRGGGDLVQSDLGPVERGEMDLWERVGHIATGSSDGGSISSMIHHRHLGQVVIHDLVLEEVASRPSQGDLRVIM